MLRYILLLLLLSTLSLALEIYIDSAQDNHQRYSTLHLRDKNEFACQEILNDYLVTTKIVCAFNKKPNKAISQLQNNFFHIQSFIKKKTFFIIIKPYAKMKLIPVIFDLTRDDSVYEPNVELSNHWMVIGYKKKLPVIHKDEPVEMGINFPFFMDKDKLPYVGGLDIEGNPVYIKKVEDVTDYLKIKKYFDKKDYERTLDLIDTVLENYPNTLFKAELLYYKIKVYNKLEDYENVISYAKEFLREYSSDENVPEVLSLIAKGYAKIGQNTDADYFFDRLFTEQRESLFAQWGLIYKGEMLEDSGGVSKAIKFYQKALTQTKDIDVAVSAAYHLAQVKSEISIKDSSEYMKKILHAKPSYLFENFKKSYELMNLYADAQKYKIAAEMADALFQKTPLENDYREELSKDRALWYAHTKEKDKALEYCNAYLKDYEEGEWANDVQVAKDSLFFDSNEQNTTVLLQQYDSLIDEYRGDTIGERATYEKAKLLLTSKRYIDVLDMQKSLESLDKEKYNDIDTIIQNAAIGAMDTSLNEKKCHEVLVIAHDYNITLSDSWDDGIYECAMKGGDFQLSKSIAQKNLSSKNLNERKKWLYRYIKVDFATGNYSEVVTASKDLIKLMQTDKSSPYRDVYRYLFDAYERLERSDDMVDAISKIQKIYGRDYKDLDRYAAMISVGVDKHDDNLVIKYAQEALAIQQSADAHPQSPFVEFALYQAYMNKQEYNKALETILILEKLELSKQDRAREKYLLGSVYAKLWREDDAKAAYKAAIDADPSSPWADLAKSAQEF